MSVICGRAPASRSSDLRALLYHGCQIENPCSDVIYTFVYNFPIVQSRFRDLVLLAAERGMIPAALAMPEATAGTVWSYHATSRIVQVVTLTPNPASAARHVAYTYPDFRSPPFPPYTARLSALTLPCVIITMELCSYSPSRYVLHPGTVIRHT